MGPTNFFRIFFFEWKLTRLVAIELFRLGRSDGLSVLTSPLYRNWLSIDLIGSWALSALVIGLLLAKKTTWLLQSFFASITKCQPPRPYWTIFREKFEKFEPADSLPITKITVFKQIGKFWDKRLWGPNFSPVHHALSISALSVLITKNPPFWLVFHSELESVLTD